MNRPPHEPPSAKAESLAATLIPVVAIVVVVVGLLAALAISGMRTFLKDARTAEARNSIAEMSRSAADAYARDRRLCPSASARVPANAIMVMGEKYQSKPGEWTRDQAQNAGFACLKFQLSTPQSYQYEYRATPTEFTVTARGDTNGDGVFSKFSITGTVQGGAVVLGAIVEKDPEE